MADAYDDLTGHAAHGPGYLGRAFALLDRLRPSGTSPDAAGNRRPSFDDYAELVLLYTWNPAVDSPRDLQAAVGPPAVAKAPGVRRFPLGSFSESVAAFDPGLPRAAVAEPVGQLRPLPDDPRLSQLKSALTAVDGTVSAALPRLARAAAGVDADGVPAAPVHHGPVHHGPVHHGPVHHGPGRQGPVRVAVARGTRPVDVRARAADADRGAERRRQPRAQRAPGRAGGRQAPRRRRRVRRRDPVRRGRRRRA